MAAHPSTPPATHSRSMQPVMSPEDESIPPVVRIMVLGEMDRSDRELLEYMARVRRVELDATLKPVDPQAPDIDYPFALMWFECRGILVGEIDPGGRLWLCATKALDELLAPEVPERGRRRRRRRT
ncbi:MAG: hypothetical protein KGI71_04860 [Patescibacteria group bacterium]|nr:hypothetical protein [Patescibacteria group bacterium]